MSTTTNAADISSAPLKHDRGFIKKAILIGLFGLLLFSLEAHGGAHTGGTCHYDHKEAEKKKSSAITMHCHIDEKIINPDEYVEIVKDHKNKNGKIVYRTITYRIVLSEKSDDGSDIKDKEIVSISIEKKTLCRKKYEDYCEKVESSEDK